MKEKLKKAGKAGNAPCFDLKSCDDSINNLKVEREKILKALGKVGSFLERNKTYNLSNNLLLYFSSEDFEHLYGKAKQETQNAINKFFRKNGKYPDLCRIFFLALQDQLLEMERMKASKDKRDKRLVISAKQFLTNTALTTRIFIKVPISKGDTYKSIKEKINNFFYGSEDNYEVQQWYLSDRQAALIGKTTQKKPMTETDVQLLEPKKVDLLLKKDNWSQLRDAEEKKLAEAARNKSKQSKDEEEDVKREVRQRKKGMGGLLAQLNARRKG